MQTNLATYNNDWYKEGKSIKGLFWYFTNALFFANSFFPLYSLKVLLLKLFGAKVGTNVLIKPNVNIKYPWLLEIGNNVWIGEQVWIDNLDQIKIGNNVCISQGALLLCGNHDYTKSTFDLKIGTIVIEDGVWISAKAVVTQNICCAKNSIIGTGAILTSSTVENGIYKGNPAILSGNRVINF